MYTIYVNFKCYEGKREAFVERVKKEGVLDAIRAEKGCVRYDYEKIDLDELKSCGDELEHVYATNDKLISTNKA